MKLLKLLKTGQARCLSHGKINPMSKIYTRTGDDGTTGLLDGSRVPKHALRVEACGTLDEANTVLGHVVRLAGEPMKSRLLAIQNDLFIIGSVLAIPRSHGQMHHAVPAVTEEDIARLEGWIDESEAALSPLHCFILPGGGELACWLHTARVTIRRAERMITRLAQEEPVSPPTLVLVNRLSDLFFSWARLANFEAGVGDIPWHPPMG